MVQLKNWYNTYDESFWKIWQKVGHFDHIAHMLILDVEDWTGISYIGGRKEISVQEKRLEKRGKIG